MGLWRAETARMMADVMAARGEKVGVLTARLYRPFAVTQFINALPRPHNQSRR